MPSRLTLFLKDAKGKMWLVVALSLGVVGNAQAMSSDYIEQALISTCKSIASDRVGQQCSFGAGGKVRTGLLRPIAGHGL